MNAVVTALEVALPRNRALSVLFDNLADFTETPEGVAKLRELILDLAVRGKLVDQDDNEVPASELISKAETERARLMNEGKLRRRKVPSSPSPRGDELPRTLPPNWQWTRLSILGEVGPRNDLGDSVEVSFLPMAAIPDGYSKAIKPEVRKWGDVKCGFTHVAEGDIVMAKITPCFQNRKSAVVRGLINGAGAGTTELHVLRPISGTIVPEYVLLHLRSPTYLSVGVTNMTGSAGQKRVPKDYFANTPFPLAPLQEQRRIVAKVDELMALCDELDAQDEKRVQVCSEANRSSLGRLVMSGSRSELNDAWRRLSDHFEVLYDTPETIGELRQAILELAVQGKLVRQDASDQSADILLSKIANKHRQLVAGGKQKESESSPIAIDAPDRLTASHWKWARLNDLVRVMNSGWSPACDDKPTGDESEWGVLKTTAVQSFEFREHEHKRLPDNLEPRPDAEARPGDLLITRAGPRNRVGISCLIRRVRPRLMISDKIIRFHLIEPFMQNEFVVLCLNAGVSRTHIEQSKSGMAASQMNISQAKFRKTPVPIPPFEEQKRIVAKVGQLLFQCEQLRSQSQGRESTTQQLISAVLNRILSQLEV